MAYPKGGDALMISWLAAALDVVFGVFFAEGQDWN
jgi:hypothetical protein